MATSAATIVSVSERRLGTGGGSAGTGLFSAAILSIGRRDPNAFRPRTAGTLTVGSAVNRLRQSLQVLGAGSGPVPARSKGERGAGTRRHDFLRAHRGALPQAPRRRTADGRAQGRRRGGDGPRL